MRKTGTSAGFLERDGTRVEGGRKRLEDGGQMKLPRLEKKLRVALQWALEVVFERDLGQYVTLRDAESLIGCWKRRDKKIPPQRRDMLVLKGSHHDLPIVRLRLHLLPLKRSASRRKNWQGKSSNAQVRNVSLGREF